jgi:hypothetical protein
MDKRSLSERDICTDNVPPTSEDGDTLPDKPGTDETIVDGLPDITPPLVFEDAYNYMKSGLDFGKRLGLWTSCPASALMSTAPHAPTRAYGGPEGAIGSITSAIHAEVLAAADVAALPLRRLLVRSKAVTPPESTSRTSRQAPRQLHSVANPTCHVNDQQGTITMQTKRIFLASSAELKEDRKEFEIFINRKNKAWVDQGVFIELIVWIFSTPFRRRGCKTSTTRLFENAISS